MPFCSKSTFLTYCHRLSDRWSWQCEGGPGVTVLKGTSSCLQNTKGWEQSRAWCQGPQACLGCSRLSLLGYRVASLLLHESILVVWALQACHVCTEDLIEPGGKTCLQGMREGLQGPCHWQPASLSHLTLEVRSSKDAISKNFLEYIVRTVKHTYSKRTAVSVLTDVLTALINSRTLPFPFGFFLGHSQCLVHWFHSPNIGIPPLLPSFPPSLKEVRPSVTLYSTTSV